MKKFKVIANGSESEMYADSLKVLKGMLRRKFSKRRLAGVRITREKNNNHQELQPPSGQQKKDTCYICGEDREEELTIDDSIIAKIICNKCLENPKEEKGSKAMAKFQLNLF